ncbi:SpoIIE family protein phosphatase [Micromonospora sp. CPCC 205711]|uniref:SpoIIE family protein phosphatase n=1 Tax=Micromonospora sp. CPCC 205547 TaxID=3122400 RepID=UPI002FEF7240
MTGRPAPGQRPSTSLGAGRRLFAAVAVVTLALGSTGALIAVDTWRAGRAAAVEEVRLRSQTVGANVYGSRLSLVRLLQAVASGRTFTGGDPAAIQRRLESIRADQLGLTGGLAWLDTTGTVRAAGRGTVGAPAGGDWWSEVAAGRAEWTTSAALTSPAFTGEVMVFAVPTSGPDGAVNGVLAGGWSMSWIRAVAARQAAGIGPEFYGPETDLLVVDRAGQLIVGPGVDRTRDISGTDLYRRLVAGGDAFASGARAERAGLSGRPDEIVGWTRIGGFGEYVALERPVADATAGPDRQLAAWLAGILLLAGLALVSGGLAGRRIDRLTAERDRLHQDEHDAVVDLQHWLLTEDLPAGTVGRYLPAPSVLNAGGDWYDVIPLGGQRHALLVGDVVGHGVKAALAMGQLRTAARALAGRVAGPGALLTELDRFVVALPDVVFATAACVFVDPATGTLRYASAGHPPPLLRLADGTVRRLAATARPLGIGSGVRTDEELPAPAGAMVVLYSDGLVESPDEVIDEGIDRLAGAIGADGAGSDDWTEQLIAAARGGRPAADDIALLCFPLPAAPGWVRPTDDGYQPPIRPTAPVRGNRT